MFNVANSTRSRIGEGETLYQVWVTDALCQTSGSGTTRVYILEADRQRRENNGKRISAPLFPPLSTNPFRQPPQKLKYSPHTTVLRIVKSDSRPKSFCNCPGLPVVTFGCSHLLLIRRSSDSRWGRGAFPSLSSPTTKEQRGSLTYRQKRISWASARTRTEQRSTASRTRGS